MLLKEAIGITGGLTTTTKLPCKSYSLPTTECKVGSKLKSVRDSVCASCYAERGNYKIFQKTIQKKAYERIRSILNPGWVDGMIKLINHQSPEFFRWHDAGDVQGVDHLKNILKVAEGTSAKHWIATKEYKLARWYEDNYNVDNLIMRVSSPLVKQEPLKFRHTSTVSSGVGFKCKTEKGACGRCRMCWDHEVKNIDYELRWGKL